MRTKSYIAEIDGLRAVAVLGVVLYHIGFSKLSGGFIGVDIFFVISGFLITGILAKEENLNIDSLKNFYFRRILRIAPALFTVLIFTIILFFLISPPAATKSLAHSAFAAGFSYSNFWFYATIDYFNSNSKNPFLHTWSLAVEEQFYFVLPLVLLVFSRQWLKYRMQAMWVLFFISLVASSFMAYRSQPAAFYFPWFRAWELLAGSLLALVPISAIPMRIKAALSNAGLVTILGSLFLYHEKMVFPGIAAMPVVLGTVAVIAGVQSPSVANWLLSIRPMRWTGNISYSLYLVHWPVICAAALVSNLLMSKTKLAVLLTSFFLAWFVWRFVETPTRQLARRPRYKRVFGAFALSCAGLIPLTFFVQSAGAALWERSPAALNYSKFLKADATLYKTGTCLLTPVFPDIKYFDKACIAQVKSIPAALVMGDSHAANVVAAISANHPSFQILQATAVGCKPLLGAAGPPYCTELMRKILKEWLPQSGSSVPYVVIAARWVKADLEPLKDTVVYLQSLGKKVIVYGPHPEFSMAVPLILAYNEIFQVDLASRMTVNDRFEIDASWASAFSESAIYFSPLKALCRETVCETLNQGTPVFSDGDHFTRSGAFRALAGFPLP